MAENTVTFRGGETGNDSHSQDGGHSVDYAGGEGLREFMGETTMHGVQYMFRGTLIVRIAWVLGVMGALSGFLYFFITAVENYRGHPTNTKIDIVGRSGLPIPAVTICNANFALTSRLTNSSCGQGPCFPNWLQNQAFVCTFFEEERSEGCPLSSTEYRNIVNNDRRTAAEILQEVGQPASDLLSDGVRAFEGLGTLTNSTDIVPEITSKGLCHTFNSRGTAGEISSLGVDGGLKFLINVDQNNYFGITLLSAGVEVYIHPPNESIVRGLRAVFVGPGQRANIALKPQYREILNRPFRNPGCIEKSINRDTSVPYSRQQCLLECQQFVAAADCHCLAVSVPSGVSISINDSYSVSRPCSAREYLDCSVAAELILLNRTVSRICRSACLQPCKPAPNQFIYDYSLSWDEFPNFIFSPFLLQAVVGSGTYNNLFNLDNRTYLKQNFAQINIFYDELEFESIVEQQAVTLASLFGSIGGNLGLFVGASMLTLLEFAQYLTRLFLAKIRKYRANRRQSREVQHTDQELKSALGNSERH